MEEVTEKITEKNSIEELQIYQEAGVLVLYGDLWLNFGCVWLNASWGAHSSTNME